MASPAPTDDEVKTFVVTSEQFAVPDNAPHLNDWTKVGLYVVIFAILGVNIWGIVDTTHYKYTPTTSSTNITTTTATAIQPLQPSGNPSPGEEQVDGQFQSTQPNEPHTPFNIINIFALTTASIGIIVAILMLVATILSKTSLFKAAYQALLMLLGAHFVVCMAVAIWFGVHRASEGKSCNSEGCAAVRVTTVSWNATDIVLYALAAALCRYAVYLLDPVLHILGKS